MRGVGTLVNVAAVIARCVAGLLAGARLPERIRGTFTEALSTASLTFSVGPLTILGSLQDGLGAGAQLLLVVVQGSSTSRRSEWAATCPAW